MSNNRALLYKVIWRDWAAEVWIRPSVLKNARAGFKNDQNMIVSIFKKSLGLGFFIKFGELLIRASKPGYKNIQNPTIENRNRKFAYNTDNFTHCGDNNCEHCEFGYYNRCPNNYE